MKNLGMFKVKCVSSGRITKAQLWLRKNGTKEWYYEGNSYNYEAFVRED